VQKAYLGPLVSSCP